MLLSKYIILAKELLVINNLMLLKKICFKHEYSTKLKHKSKGRTLDLPIQPTHTKPSDQSWLFVNVSETKSL